MEILKSFQTGDALLLAIDEEYVEGVELLLEHEERIWKVRKMKRFESEILLRYSARDCPLLGDPGPGASHLHARHHSSDPGGSQE